MTKQSWLQIVGWGLLLWLVGYVLGFVLFPFVPTAMLGWVITPIGVFLTLFVLFKKISLTTVWQYALMGVVWTLIAIVGDYIGIVKLLHPADGYYKFDVYLYYTLTFLLPLTAGIMKEKSVTLRRTHPEV